jgi:hypothetical protein
VWLVVYLISGSIETGKKWASPNTMVKLADVFNIDAYELLKPADILSDKSSDVIQRYTEDICNAINNVRDSYLTKLHSK